MFLKRQLATLLNFFHSSKLAVKDAIYFSGQTFSEYRYDVSSD